MKLNERHAWFRLFVHFLLWFYSVLKYHMHPIRPGRIASAVTTLMTGEVYIFTNESERENT